MTDENDIETAISQYMSTNDPDKAVIGWIAFVAHTNGNESGVNTIISNDSMPWTHALGIVEAGRIKMHREWGDDA